jgi:pimeloyl-ACP methyl ester carboxylesterase
MSTPPALLLLHGTGDSGACWEPFVARLRGLPGLSQLHVGTPDLPAHGGRRSEPGHTVAWPDLLAEAVEHAEQLTSASGAPVVVGGHSLGATVALGVAASRPDLVAGLFLEDPPFTTSLAEDAGRPMGESVDLAEFRDWFASLQSATEDEVLATVRREHPTWDPAEYGPWVRAKRSVDITAFEGSVPWVRVGWADQVRAVRCPALLVAGVAGGAAPEGFAGGIVHPAAAAELALLPGWTVHTVPASHDVRRDAPQATAALLAELIRGVPA